MVRRSMYFSNHDGWPRHYSYLGSSPFFSSLVLVTSTTVAAFVFRRVVPKVRSFLSSHGGGAGLLRLVWEGDHLSPSQRSALETLELWELRIVGCADLSSKSKWRRSRTLSERVESAEIDLDTAIMNTVDGGIVCTDPKLLAEFASLSHDLDAAAAGVDSVIILGGRSGSSQTHGPGSISTPNGVLRAKKKLLSADVVRLMGRIDSLIEKASVKDHK
mmetsp:Transcript_13608/g.27115  ORF Transcript_13608/g.27115 Transcript_13608/m.27115 type:complete len:217 (+) Transcript_13608:67-717(+)